MNIKSTLSSFVLLIPIIFSNKLYSQNVSINTTGTAANASAILDLSNTSNMAFLPPQVSLANVATLAPVPAPGPAGLIVYNTNAAVVGGSGTGFYFWDGAKWNYLSTGGPAAAWNLTGNAGTTPGTNFAGTSDPKDFVIKTNAVERMRVLSTGSAGIGTATPMSAVDVNGNMSIGTYAGVTAAPANGMIIPGQVGIGTSAPNASAILDLTNSIKNLGFELPNMTTAQRNAIVGPVKGLMVFNNTTGCINFWTGFAWENIVCPTCTGPAATPGAITGSLSPVISTTGNVYSISSVPGAISYTWSVLPLSAGTVVTSGQGTTSITITFGAAIQAYTICVYDSNACGISAKSCITATTTSCTHSSLTFNYTGAVQTWTVPACITQITVTMAGAQGGTGGWATNTTQNAGGNGGSLSGVLPVASGTVLDMYVGGKGAAGTSAGGGVGGYNGGGFGDAGYSAPAPFPYYGGGGGGASDIRVTPYALANRKVVAGGGGGAGFNYFACCNYEQGGPGGAATGGCGWSGNVQCGGLGPGGGGTQLAGGPAGTWGGYCTGNPGTLGLGGNGCLPTCNAGGGGGGGYYGGGSGVWSGGGGGSNYTSALTTVTSNSQGTQSGNGFITIQW